MTSEEAQLLRERFARIRRVKRLLRPLPRRATVHRYPFLKWFAATARKRSYLWSFRLEHALPALYVGSILAFLPVYGVQIPLAFLLALACRGNLPIFIGLQMITNPVTVVPIYFAEFQIAHLFLKIFGIESIQVSMSQLHLFLNDFFNGQWGDNVKLLASVWGLTMLGGAITGTFVGTIASQVYKTTARRGTATLQRLRELQQARETKERAEVTSQSKKKRRPLPSARSLLARKKRSRRRK